MVDKITLTNLVDLQNETAAVSAINNNNAAVTTAMNNTLSRDGTSPNQMGAALDMNSQPILNLPVPISGSSPVRLQDLSTITGGGTIAPVPAGGTTGQVLSKNSNTNYDMIWANTGANLTGPITSTASVTAVASQTGTGSTFVMNTSPTLVTPNLGVASATSVNKVALTAPATGSTLTIADGKTLTVNNSVTLAGGEGTTQTFPSTSGTLVSSTTSSGGDLTGTYPSPTVASSAITNAKMANMAASTFKGNNTTSSAAPTDFTIDGLTIKSVPAAADEMIIWDVAGSALKKATVSSVGAGGTVASIAGNSGAFTLAGGITNSTNQIQLDGNYTGFAIPNCTLAATVASNILTVALKDNTGADPSTTSPVYINYRNPTAATGTTALVSQTSALSITTNAVGATLGSSNTTPFRLWVLVFNNAGTNVLALYNASTVTFSSGVVTAAQMFPLNSGSVLSTTPMSSSATSAGVAYTPNGTTLTSKAFRILGYVEYNAGLTTAGTYASAPTNIQVFGPGIRKPGEPTGNTVHASTSAATGVISTNTYAATNLTANITPTSSANLIRAEISGMAEVDASGKSVVVAIHRGSTRITGGIGAFGTGPTILMSAINISTLDLPGVTSSTVYSAKARNTDNATNVKFPTDGFSTDSPWGYITLTEIMG